MPQLFFEILGEPAERGDEYEFASVEVKQTAFRIDGVFTPKPDSAEQTVIFVEVQFQKDEQLYERFFSEIMMFLAQNLEVEDWRAIAVYPRRSIEQENRYRYRTLLNSEQFQVIYLEDFLAVSSEQIGVQLMQLIVSKKDETSQYLQRMVPKLRGKTDSQNQAIIELVSTILLYKFPEFSREEIQAMFTVSDLKQTQVYREALDEGLEQGLEQGLERERSLLIRQLTRKIGELSLELTAKIKTLSFEQLDALGEALFDFENSEQLNTWLENL